MVFGLSQFNRVLAGWQPSWLAARLYWLCSTHQFGSAFCIRKGSYTNHTYLHLVKDVSIFN